MRQVHGQPLLQYLLDRLQAAKDLPPFQIATSDDPGDDLLAEFCRERDLPCFRGSLHNVAGRFLDAAEAKELDAFVRISGDSPLLDTDIVRRALAEFHATGADLVTNVMPRSYPPGQSVEVLRVDRFREALGEMTEPEDLEHVTRFHYRNPTRFVVHNFSVDPPYPSMHMAVDTAEQFVQVQAVLGLMTRPHWEYGLAEIAALYAELPDRSPNA